MIEKFNIPLMSDTIELDKVIPLVDQRYTYLAFSEDKTKLIGHVSG